MKRTLLVAFLACTLTVLTDASSRAADEPLGKLFIKAAKAKVDGQDFADQELEDSVKDLKKRAKKFLLVEDESQAELLLVVVKRETKVGQPSLMKHKTPRNVNDLHATISIRENEGWKPGVQLSSNGCCQFWADAASKIMSETEKWAKQQEKR